MGFFDDLFALAMKKAGCDPETSARMGGKSDRELIDMARNRSGHSKIGACAELKKRYGTDEAREKIRRGY